MNKLVLDKGQGKINIRRTTLYTPIDENVDVVLQNQVDLVLHLFFLGNLELGDLCNRVHSDLGTEHFDLVRVHWRVRNEDAGVFNTLWLVDTRRLVQQKT